MKLNYLSTTLSPMFVNKHSVYNAQLRTCYYQTKACYGTLG